LAGVKAPVAIDRKYRPRLRFAVLRKRFVSRQFRYGKSRGCGFNKSRLSKIVFL
jgi:hypothetical protein